MHTPYSYEAELQHRHQQIRAEVADARRRRHPRPRFPQWPAGTSSLGLVTRLTA